MSDDYEDDFVDESPSAAVTPAAAAPAAASGRPSVGRQLSVSQFKGSYSAPISQKHAELINTAAAAPSGAGGDAARVKELEAKLEALEREVSANRVKLRRAGRPSAGGAGDSFTESSSSSSSSFGGFGSSSSASDSLGSNSARIVPFSAIELGEQISGGGFCLLYKSKWNGIDVAVKRIFDPNVTQQLKDEFYNEVNMLSNLAHPHIVQILAQVNTPPNLCIVTEFLPRGSLYHVLHESAVDMTRVRKLNMSLQLAQAIQFLHSCGVVHRDIKSHNALADEFLRVKLCDFGMAITSSRLACAPKTAEVAGTPNYMSNELFKGEVASFASDMYAYGILLNEVWTKEVPWEGVEPREIARRVVAGERPKIGLTVPREISQIVKECTNALASARPKDFKRIIQTFNQMLQQPAPQE